MVVDDVPLPGKTLRTAVPAAPGPVSVVRASLLILNLEAPPTCKSISSDAAALSVLVTLSFITPGKTVVALFQVVVRDSTGAPEAPACVCPLPDSVVPSEVKFVRPPEPERLTHAA